MDLTRNLTLLTTSDLEELRFGSINHVRIVDWVASLVARRFTTLPVLEIGVEIKTTQYHHDNDPNTQLTERFRHELENNLVDLHDSSSPPSSVRSLTLVGLDLLAL